MKKRFALLAALLLTALWPWGTLAAESGEEAVYRLKNDQDGVVAQIASVPDVGDEYIASDNA